MGMISGFHHHRKTGIVSSLDMSAPPAVPCSKWWLALSLRISIYD